VNQILADAEYAALGRLLVPHDTPEERQDAAITAQVHLSNAVTELLAASRALCMSDNCELADLVDQAQHQASIADSLVGKLIAGNLYGGKNGGK